MPVICLEGALAVGKSSTATALTERYGAFIVPEMNRLFRPDNPDDPNRKSFGEYVAQQPPDWYLLRQVDRWQMASEASRTHPLAILDRDPFQPLWYRWAFGYEGEGQSLEDLCAFYRPRIAEGSLQFPEVYFLLTAPMEELQRRKENDAIRDRRGFEKQKRFIEPQKRYFTAMKHFDESRVHIVATSSIEENVAFIHDVLDAFPHQTRTHDNLSLFDFMSDWLRQNPLA